MAYYRDFREHLDALEKAGRVRRISDPVDKDREMHPLVRWQYRGIAQEDRFGFLFEHVTDRTRPPHSWAHSLGSPANREMYAMSPSCAGWTRSTRRWARGYANPIKTRLVESGPVKEEIHKGDACSRTTGCASSAFLLPLTGGKISRITAAAMISRDPETGQYNAGMYNSIVYGNLRTNLRTTRHLHSQWNKARAMGKPLEVAIVLGAVPVVPLVATTDVPAAYEARHRGGIVADRVVKCETVDLEVPATAGDRHRGHHRPTLW